MRRMILCFVAVCAFLALQGCGPENSSETPPPPTPTPTPDPQLAVCVSTVPFDSGDPNRPVITLNGPRVVSQPVGQPYTDPGATAADPVQGDISSRITVTGIADVNTSAVGDYMIRYNVVNGAQLAATEVVRMVRVNAGTFRAQSARDIGSTGAHMGYYEHLPVNYTDAGQLFPLIIYQHGSGGARFDDYGVIKTPLNGLEEGNMVKLINDGLWDDSRPFIVLSPQRCQEPRNHAAERLKLFIDYAVSVYKVDPSRIYMAGYSAGSSLTWDYAALYPDEIAAVVPMSGSYGEASGCVLRETPSWAFEAADDPVGPYINQVQTVASINACSPVERAKITVFPSGGHNTAEEYLTINLTGLGMGLPEYDVYNQNIYDWLLQHSRVRAAAIRPYEAARVAAPTAGLELSVSPRVIAMGQSARLKWAGSGICTASGDWLGSRPSGGTEAVTPIAAGWYGYVLSCSGSGGTVAQSMVLQVRPEAASKN